MTWLPRGLTPKRTSNVVRRGRVNQVLLAQGGVIGGDADPAPGGDSDPPTVSLPDLLQAVVDYRVAHPADFALACPYGAGTWAFLDGLVAALQVLDARVGFCWRPERNDFAGDALCYYHGVLPPVDDSPDVYVVDVIIESCSVNAAPSWNNVTDPAVVRAWRLVRV